MRLATLRRPRPDAPLPGVHGAARVDDDVARLASRSRPGEIAVIERLDLDAPTARLLVGAGVAAVVNASASTSGRYPNLGPQVLVEAGVPVLDRVGPEVMRVLRDGDRLRLDGDVLFRGEDVVARGELLSHESVRTTMEQARAGMALQLEAFAANTVEHLRQEHDLLLDGEGVPEVATRLSGRPVVVLSAGTGWRDDLERLRPWMAVADPVLVGVDGGAGALLSAGLRPDLLVGNPDLLSEEALLCGAEVVVRAERTGWAPGAARAEQHGARTVVFPTSGSSEDAALLLVDAHDAALIVTAGCGAATEEFVDRARADMASTFLARLKVGTRLVDASAVAAVHRPAPRTWPLWVLVLLLLAGVLATVVLSGDGTPVGQWRDALVDEMSLLVDQVAGLLGGST